MLYTVRPVRAGEELLSDRSYHTTGDLLRACLEAAEVDAAVERVEAAWGWLLDTGPPPENAHLRAMETQEARALAEAWHEPEVGTRFFYHVNFLDF